MSKQLTATEALRRMKKGEIMRSIGYASSMGVFEDGTRVSHRAIYSLLKRGKIIRPEIQTVNYPFMLVGGE